MEITKDEPADRAHLCPGHWESSTRGLVCSCLSFCSGCSCLCQCIIPRSDLLGSERSIGEECLLYRCVCTCGHMWAGLLRSDLRVSLPGGLAECRLLEKALCFHWDKTYGCLLLPMAYPYLVFCSYNEVRLIPREIRALVSAATGMCLSQLLPCFFRCRQALPQFQIAAGFQDWHQQLYVHL